MPYEKFPRIRVGIGKPVNGDLMEYVIGAIDDEDKNAVSKWWDNLVDGIAGWFKNWAAGIVSDLIHDLKFKNVTIIDNELVITVSYAENKD